MALTLKQLVQTNIYGTEVWITDKTGAYVAVTNPGGYGTPNPALSRSALVAMVKRSDGSDLWLEPLTPQVVHNPSAGNEDINYFSFKYENDGHHYAYLIRLRVSTDGGATDLDGVAITEGQYFAIGTTVYRRQSSANTLVPAASYPTLLADSTLSKATCEVMFYNKLLIKNRDYYKEYAEERNDSYEEARKWLFKYDDLRADIQGADYTFRSGLRAQAENIVKTLLEKHRIV